MKVLITTFGRNEERINTARRDIGYEKLVIVTDEGGKDTITETIKMENIVGGEVEVVIVDSYNFLDCFTKIEDTINKYRKHDAKVNVSGGTKLLASAALLVCFNKGIQAYHCGETTIKLPIITGVSFNDALDINEKRLLSTINKDEDGEKLKKKSGMSAPQFDSAVSGLEKLGLVGIMYKGRKSKIGLTAMGKIVKTGVKNDSRREKLTTRRIEKT